MNIKEAQKILKDHNIWRRGADTDMGCVTKLGIAIDTVIDYIDSKEGISTTADTKLLKSLNNSKADY